MPSRQDGAALYSPAAFTRDMLMSAPLFLSSGDVVADRRYEYAREWETRGELAAAAELMEQALDIAPGFASAWFALGEMREKLGDPTGAIAAFERARQTDPADRHGAQLHLIRLGAAPLADIPPDYVAELFDQYAPRFEKALVESLRYRAPQLLREAVLQVCRDEPRAAQFARMIDLGCGTGLAARAFVDICKIKIGVDLSTGMLARAQEEGLYDALHAADMVGALEQEADASADLVLAADAVIYLADLSPLCRAAARVLRSGGLLAFTAETHDGEGVRLGEKLRYAFAPGYVGDVMKQAGFRVALLAHQSSRDEAGKPVPGLVAVGVRV